MKKSLKTLGEKSSTLLMALSSQNKNLFGLSDAQQVLKENNPEAVRKLLSRLVEKKWLERLEGGRYLIIPLEAGPESKWSEETFVIASQLIDPYTISYWSALNYYGYTEQIPHTVFISSTKRKSKSETEVLGIPYKFITLSSPKYFGLTKIWIADKQITITDKEKTIIDCLDHPEYCGGIIEAAKGLFNTHQDKIDFDKITKYAQKMKNKTIFKRLGYLSEILDLPLKKQQSIWNKNISTGYPLLDPTQSKTGKFDTRWNLRVNIEKQHLTSWRTH